MGTFVTKGKKNRNAFNKIDQNYDRILLILKIFKK